MRADPGTGTKQSQRVWFITGTSTGLGRSIALEALAGGDRIIATARSLSTIEDIAKDYPGSCHILELDVTTDFQTLRAKAIEAVDIWGHIDVLVNNAGVGMLGITEEVGTEGYEMQMRTNFFGQINVTNTLLPHMRERRSGTIVFISSRSSWRSALPMLGPYAASKAALNAAAEALSVEVAPFGIRVLSVLPSSLRTNNLVNTVWLPPNHSWTSNTVLSTGGDQVRGPVQEYEAIHAPQKDLISGNIGKQPGDPSEAARIVVNVVRGDHRKLEGKVGASSSDWPDLGMLVLGTEAEANIREKCERILKNLDAWREAATSVDFANAE